LVDVIKQSWLLSSKLDSSASLVQRLYNENFNKVAFLEDSKKRQQGGADPSGLKGERFVGEERVLIAKGEKI